MITLKTLAIVDLYVYAMRDVKDMLCWSIIQTIANSLQTHRAQMIAGDHLTLALLMNLTQTLNVEPLVNGMEDVSLKVQVNFVSSDSRNILYNRGKKM